MSICPNNFSTKWPLRKTSGTLITLTLSRSKLEGQGYRSSFTVARVGATSSEYILAEQCTCVSSGLNSSQLAFIGKPRVTMQISHTRSGNRRDTVYSSKYSGQWQEALGKKRYVCWARKYTSLTLINAIVKVNTRHQCVTTETVTVFLTSAHK